MNAEPQSTSSGPSLGRGLIIAAAVAIVLIGMRFGSYLVVLVVFSALVTLLLAPLQQRLLARGMRTSVALSLCIGTYVVVLGVAAVIVIIGVADFVNNLPSYRNAIEVAMDKLFGPSELAQQLVGVIADVAQSLVSTIGSGVVVIGYSVIVVAYFLVEARRGRKRLLWAARGNDEVVDRSLEMTHRMQSFVVARTVLGLVAAVVETVVLIVLGIPSALLWGVLSFLMSFVPNIGFIVALIPPAVLALGLYGPLMALAVVVAYSITNFAVDYILQPRYIGTSVNMSALIVTLSIVFWGLILGPAGALLAIPLTIAAIALADSFPDSRPFARLLVDDVEPTTD
ncbi:MAG TPA: AI-2E family transporter [Candidatus Limnocylindrales bacterium]